MKELLFKKVFERAKNQSGRESKNGVSEYLSDVISDDFKFPIASRTFVRYYEKYIEKSVEVGNDPRTDLLDIISKYLQYENYESFVLKNKSKKKRKKKKRNKIIIIICSIIFATVIGIFSFNQSKFMVWKENQYVRVKFDLKKYDISQLKIYKAEWVKDFRQIVPGCGVTKFFNEDGSPNLWYGKSQEGKLEYFTHYGLHPKTGKTLKPITDYMIRRHICK